MKTIVYTVHAYRWGDRECHSYIVGVFSKKHAAIKAADHETEYRGGKYECEIIEWEVDNRNVWKPIRELPEINVLDSANKEWEAAKEQK